MEYELVVVVLVLFDKVIDKCFKYLTYLYVIKSIFSKK